MFGTWASGQKKQIGHLFFLTKGLRNVADYTFINEALSKLLSWLISLIFANTATEYSVGNSFICVCFLKIWINSKLMGLIKTLWNSCDSFINNYTGGKPNTKYFRDNDGLCIKLSQQYNARAKNNISLELSG